MAILLLFGCASPDKNTNGETPLEAYRLAMSQKGGDNNNQYSIEFLRSQAAMYLLSQGKTDLKSGNSIRAVQRLSEARNLNPWNDEIKDFYNLSVRSLVKVAKRLDDENCDVINDRLGFIYSVAPDQMTELKEIATKCNFKIGASSTEEFHSLPLSEQGQNIEQAEIKSLAGEIERLVKKNKYVPRKELLYLGLSFLADLEIVLGEPSVGSEVDDKSSIRLLVPIATKYSGDLTSHQYCEKAKTLLQNIGYEEEIGDSPVNRVKADGYLECRHFYGSVRTLSFYSSPNWPEQIINIWPLPKDVIVDFVLHFQNGQKKSYRNVVSILALPDQIEYGIGMKFMFTEGELPFILRYSKAYGSEKRYALRGEEDLIEFSLPSHELTGLKTIEAKINLQETFKDSYDQKYKSRGKHGPGGIIFDN